MHGSSSLSWSDRVVCALVCGFIAAITAAVLSALLLARVETWSVYFWSRSLPLALALTCAAGLGGFFLGPERMANVFGVAWGTSEPNTWQMLLIVVVVLASCWWLAW